MSEDTITTFTTTGFTQRAVELADTNVEQGGKPFACVVVDRETGEVVHEATNHIAQTGDVTAHAEITAIRELAAGRTDLTAYPCPMCLGSLCYAAPEQAYYTSSRDQEGDEYEDGSRYMTLATFYEEYAKPVAEQNLPLVHVPTDDPTAPFRPWTSRNHR